VLVGAFANDGVLYMRKAPILIPDLRSEVPNLPGIQQAFRSDLQAFLEVRLSAADRKRIYAAADKIVLVSRTAEDGVRGFQYVAPNLEAVVGYAMGLLLNPLYGNDLKQCQWKDCRRFFFVSERRRTAEAAGKERTGKLPDRYCREEHMRAAHRARATEATLRRRKEQREHKLKVAAAPAAKAKVR